MVVGADPLARTLVPQPDPALCFVLVRHRRRRPAGDETGAKPMVIWHGALGTEVGFCLVRESPLASWTRDSGAPLIAPRAGDGSGARFLEFL